MTASTFRFRIILIFLCCFSLIGCISSSQRVRHEVMTSSDQTEAQRRAGIRLQLAIGYFGQHQLEVALDEVKQALLADPDLSDGYSVRGLIYMSMDQPRLAEDDFQHALRLDPNNPDYANNYGWFLCQNARPRESIAYFESALKVRSYQSPAKALSNAGVCSLKMNDVASAERFLLKASQLDSGDSVVNLHLAQLAYGRNDYQMARFYTDLILKKGAADAEALWTAIKVEHKLGDREAEMHLVTQLRDRFSDSREFAAYQRGAWNE